MYVGAFKSARLSRTPYPLLPKAVFQVVDFSVVPVDADAHQEPWGEAVLSQNHKVGEETPKSLNHPWRHTHSLIVLTQRYQPQLYMEYFLGNEGKG